MPRPKKTATAQEAMDAAETQETKEKMEAELPPTPFNIANYQISNDLQTRTVVIEETGDEFDVKMKQLSWSRRNQILAQSITWDGDGNTAFNSDAYVRSCLKETLMEAPWGRTTESFLISIDARLGAALERLVPKAFTDDTTVDSSAVKKE